MGFIDDYIPWVGVNARFLAMKLRFFYEHGVHDKFKEYYNHFNTVMNYALNYFDKPIPNSVPLTTRLLIAEYECLSDLVEGELSVAIESTSGVSNPALLVKEFFVNLIISECLFDAFDYYGLNNS